MATDVKEEKRPAVSKWDFVLVIFIFALLVAGAWYYARQPGVGLDTLVFWICLLLLLWIFPFLAAS